MIIVKIMFYMCHMCPDDDDDDDDDGVVYKGSTTENGREKFLLIDC